MIRSWSAGLFTFLVLITLPNDALAQDWAGLNRYAAENSALEASLPEAQRIVFFGNSITESWPKFQPEFFSGKPYVGRGISGQTTPQMLVRFRPDVIDLQPAAVVILAGTNDIAGNTGPMTLEQILGNLISMCELAKANDINVILCSVLPTNRYPWQPELKPADDIIELNKRIKTYATSADIMYLDYYSNMVDQQKGLRMDLSYDGVHPDINGYKVMAALVDQALAKILKKRWFR